jgi:hypothetical protein
MNYLYFPLFRGRLSFHSAHGLSHFSKCASRRFSISVLIIFDVGELAPTSDIAVFRCALNLHNKFFH